MNILIIGGTGFISSEVVKNLLGNEYNVTLLTRGRTPIDQFPAEKVEILTGDRNDIVHVSNLMAGRYFDAILDFVAYNARDARSAVKCFNGVTDHYIHCSTISVYMVSSDPVCPITEDQDHFPLMEFWQENPFGMQYGIDKRRCENVFWNAFKQDNFPYTALRPTYVSGPGDPVGRDYFWARRLMDGGPLLLPEGGKYQFHQVYVRDVALAFVNTLGKPKTIGQKYNIASGEFYSLGEYLEILSNLLSVSPELIEISDEWLSKTQLPDTLTNGFPFHTCRDAVFSIAGAKKDLEYSPTPLMSWLPETVHWFSKKDPDQRKGTDWRKDEINFINKIKSVQ